MCVVVRKPGIVAVDVGIGPGERGTSNMAGDQGLVGGGLFLYLLHLKIRVKVGIISLLDLGSSLTKLGRKKKMKLPRLLLIVPKASLPILSATLTITDLTTKGVA